jgi:ribonuclease J
MGPATDPSRLIALGAAGVTAMVCDSTNALREGRSPSETDVARSLARLIAGAKRRVAVTIFASNVARIKAVADAARSAGRQIVVAGRALHRIIGVAMETGYLPADFKYHDQQHFSYLEPDEVCLLCTGSQGEPRAAMARIAEDQHPDVRLGQGRSRHLLLAHHSRQRARRSAIQNRLVDLGCDIVSRRRRRWCTSPAIPRREELKEMYGWGEAAHRHPHARGGATPLRARQACPRRRRPGRCSTFATATWCAWRPGSAEIVDEAPVGRLFRDGQLLVPSEDGPVRERRSLAFAGIVIVALARSGRGEIADAEIALDGVPAADAGGRKMVDIVREAVEGTIASIPRERRRDGELVREAVRRAVPLRRGTRVGQASHRQGAAGAGATLSSASPLPPFSGERVRVRGSHTRRSKVPAPHPDPLREKREEGELLALSFSARRDIHDRDASTTSPIAVPSSRPPVAQYRATAGC